MTLTLPQLEVYEKRYLAILRELLPAALAEVEAFWANPPDPLDPDPLALPAIEHWLGGPIPPEALLDYIDTLPAIAVEATTLGGDDVGPLVDSLIAHVYVAGDDPDSTHKLCHRYALAVAEVLSHQYDGLGVKERGKLSIITDEVISPDEALFLKSAHVPVPLHIVGRL